ncbi:hypothetical protein GCM10011344_20530 [Dokdonia pacifica]|uniref:Uncharacterized protein n=1 Tax=Dokdonia pacifica TaxID=1627892 RepID=A0A238VNE6_9FLAO|nr:hypothetical protein GCM10011344_20530 [Dokdonia pacifica]SNR35701.1 hypothetical protein SAMN06265376_10179 [Dokdonia pacifica]
MSNNNTTYNNLQEYLEFRCSNSETVSEELLKQIKQDYRKIYLSQYHKQYRKQYIQISFRIDKKQYQEFEQQAQQHNIPVTTYIKRIATQDRNISNTTNIASIVVIILEVIDLLEEAIYEDTIIDKRQLLSLIQQCQTLLDDSKSPVS